MPLAQLNIGRALAPMDSPIMAAFAAALDEVNALAEASPGFLWRFKTDAGNATDYIATEDPLLLVNLSVWQDYASLEAFAYSGRHREFLMRRKEWFELPQQAHFVLWNVAEGEYPTPAQALERLAHLRAQGDSDYAFTPAYLRRRT